MHLRTERRVRFRLGQYNATVDDFTNDLTGMTGSDALEEVLHHCRNDEVCKKLLFIVNEADQEYRAATVDNGGTSISPYCHVEYKPGWWWRGRPKSGPLADYLWVLLNAQAGAVAEGASG